MRTSHLMPASFRVRQTPSRAFGLGVPGSTSRHRLLVDEAHGHGGRNVGDLGRAFEQWQVAQDQRALGEDRERIRRLGQGREDARHQSVATLGPLVAIDVGAHRHVVPAPRRLREFGSQQGWRIHLDDDLGVEVEPGAKVEIGVGVAREAIPAGVRAAAVGIDRPPERQPRRSLAPCSGSISRGPRRRSCPRTAASRRCGSRPVGQTASPRSNLGVAIPSARCLLDDAPCAVVALGAPQH